MTKPNTDPSNSSVCDMKYLEEMTGMKPHLIGEIMDIFLTQIPEELEVLSRAIALTDYAQIKTTSHNMKSSVSVMGIISLAPLLHEMQALGEAHGDMARIRNLNQTLETICQLALIEIQKEKPNYIRPQN
jgi:HPt (histidine-containing phosphotransfer) domain-containing protein